MLLPPRSPWERFPRAPDRPPSKSQPLFPTTSHPGPQTQFDPIRAPLLCPVATLGRSLMATMPCRHQGRHSHQLCLPFPPAASRLPPCGTESNSPLPQTMTPISWTESRPLQRCLPIASTPVASAQGLLAVPAPASCFLHCPTQPSLPSRLGSNAITAQSIP